MSGNSIILLSSLMLIINCIVTTKSQTYGTDGYYIYEVYPQQVYTNPNYQLIYPNYIYNTQPVQPQKVDSQPSFPTHKPHSNFNSKPQQKVDRQEAEWVCTNKKTNDMMIITSEDIPTSKFNNEEPQYKHHQQQRPQRPNTNSNNYQDQPMFAKVPVKHQPTYPTTERHPRPAWTESTSKPVRTTTEEELLPIWPSDTQTKRPSVNHNGNGFIVNELTTRAPNPFFDPTNKPHHSAQTTTENDSSGGIELVIG